MYRTLCAAALISIGGVLLIGGSAAGQTACRPVPQVAEGLYTAPQDAFMHTETLLLRGGQFHRFISTDVMWPPETTLGTYCMMADRILVLLDSKHDEIPGLAYIVDSIGGRPVLRKAGVNRVATERDLNPYRLLVWVTDSLSPGRPVRAPRLRDLVRTSPDR
jgi:hypothetical protein